MKRWSAWLLAAVVGGGAIVFGLSAGARASMQDSAPQPVIVTPADGATVREKVRIEIPRNVVEFKSGSGVDEGFVAIYVDSQFKAALAPPPLPEVEVTEEGAKPAPPQKPEPIVYHWDTKEVIDDLRLTPDQATTKDGPHVLEVRSYSKDGMQVGRTQITVNVANKIDVPRDHPVRLVYRGRDGDLWYDHHTVDLTAQPGDIRLASAGSNPFTRLVHKETSKYLLSIEDTMPAFNRSSVRERREPQIEIVTNNQKQNVNLDSSSVYYTLTSTGKVEPSGVMKRTKREPFINILELPGRTVRLNEPPFETRVRVHLGTYIPTILTVDDARATLEGMEWEGGHEAVKIKVTYTSGDYKLSILDHGIQEAPFTLKDGTSTIWFAEKVGRIVRADHKINGVMKVSTSQVNPNAGGLGGGGFGDGALGGTGGTGMGPGMMPGMTGPPGMMGRGGAAGGTGGTGGRMSGPGGNPYGGGPAGAGGAGGSGGTGGGAGGAGGARGAPGRGSIGSYGRPGGNTRGRGGFGGGGAPGIPGYGGIAGGATGGGAPGIPGFGGPGGDPGIPGDAMAGPAARGAGTGGAFPGAPGGFGPGGFGGGGAAAPAPPPETDFYVNLKVSTVARGTKS